MKTKTNKLPLSKDVNLVAHRIVTEGKQLTLILYEGDFDASDYIEDYEQNEYIFDLSRHMEAYGDMMKGIEERLEAEEYE